TSRIQPMTLEQKFRPGVLTDSMRTRLFSTVALIFTVIAFVAAQTPPGSEFEVATVKRVAPGPPGQPITINLGTFNNGRVTFGNVTLSECIQFAYDLMSDSQVAGPEWIKDREVRFDIVAQASPETRREQVVVMVRALLAERLKLAAHEEKRELPFLALTVAKNGPKMAPGKELVPNGPPPRLGAGRIHHDRISLAIMTTLLSRFERQIVLDLTGLSGYYAVDLQWTPDSVRALARPDGAPLTVNGQAVDPNGASLYTAIQEQLGL